MEQNKIKQAIPVEVSHMTAFYSHGHVCSKDDSEPKVITDSDGTTENSQTDMPIYFRDYVISLDQIMKIKIEKEPYLIEPFLQKSKVVVLNGSSDGGKTYFALDCARAICNKDETFIGQKITAKYKSAIVFASEDTVSDIQARFARMYSERIVHAGGLRFIFETVDPVKVAEEELTKLPADLVVIDTFGDFFRGNINDSIDVRKFFRPYIDLARKHGCCILFIHHIGKGKESNPTPSKNDTLGSQAIESASRAMLFLKKLPDGKRVLTIVKGNNIPDELKNKGLILDFDPENGFQPSGPTISYGVSTGIKVTPLKHDPVIVGLVKELRTTHKSCRKIATALEKQGKTVGRQTISEIIRENGMSGQGPGNNPDGHSEAA